MVPEERKNSFDFKLTLTVNDEPSKAALKKKKAEASCFCSFKQDRQKF